MSPSKQQNKISSVQLARFFEFYQEKKSSLTVENYPELVKELLLLIKTPIIFIHLQHYDEAITTFIKDICQLQIQRITVQGYYTLYRFIATAQKIMDGLKIPRHILATLRAKLDPLIGHFLRIADQSMISVLQLYLVACLTDTHEHCEEIANILHKQFLSIEEQTQEDYEQVENKQSEYIRKLRMKADKRGVQEVVSQQIPVDEFLDAWEDSTVDMRQGLGHQQQMSNRMLSTTSRTRRIESWILKIIMGINLRSYLTAVEQRLLRDILVFDQKNISSVSKHELMMFVQCLAKIPVENVVADHRLQQIISKVYYRLSLLAPDMSSDQISHLMTMELSYSPILQQIVKDLLDMHFQRVGDTDCGLLYRFLQFLVLFRKNIKKEWLKAKHMSVVIKGIAEELSKGKQKAERATQWFIKLIDSGFFKQHVETMLDIAVLPGLELNYGVAFGISQYGVKYPLNILEQLLKIQDFRPYMNFKRHFVIAVQNRLWPNTGFLQVAKTQIMPQLRKFGNFSLQCTKLQLAGIRSPQIMGDYHREFREIYTKQMLKLSENKEMLMDYFAKVVNYDQQPRTLHFLIQMESHLVTEMLEREVCRGFTNICNYSGYLYTVHQHLPKVLAQETPDPRFLKAVLAFIRKCHSQSFLKLSECSLDRYWSILAQLIEKLDLLPDEQIKTLLYFLRRPLSTIRNLKGSMYYKIFLENVLRLIQLYKEELDDFDLIVLALRQALWGNLLKPKYIDETLFTKQQFNYFTDLEKQLIQMVKSGAEPTAIDQGYTMGNLLLLLRAKHLHLSLVEDLYQWCQFLSSLKTQQLSLLLIHFSLPKSVTAWNILRKLCQLYLSRTDQGQVDVLAMFANLYFYADEDLPEIVNVFELLLNFYASSPEKYCMVDHVEILNICEALKIYPKTYLQRLVSHIISGPTIPVKALSQGLSKLMDFEWSLTKNQIQAIIDKYIIFSPEDVLVFALHFEKELENQIKIKQIVKKVGKRRPDASQVNYLAWNYGRIRFRKNTLQEKYKQTLPAEDAFKVADQSVHELLTMIEQATGSKIVFLPVPGLPPSCGYYCIKNTLMFIPDSSNTKRVRFLSNYISLICQKSQVLALCTPLCPDNTPQATWNQLVQHEGLFTSSEVQLIVETLNTRYPQE